MLTQNPKLTRSSDEEVGDILQTIRQTESKLMKETDASNVTIRKICKEEKPQRHHSTKQRQRKRDVSLFHRTLGRALAS